MLLYKYEAISSGGEKISGSIFAENYRSAYKLLHSQKSCPLKIVPVPISSGKISIEDLLVFFLHIDLQLKCKMRVNEAIESFLKLHGNKVLKSSLASILIDLRNGDSLGNAFEKCSKLFDPVITGLLKSAEKTGNIAGITSNILKFLKLRAEWKNHIKRAIGYPIFIACVALLVLVSSIALLGPQVSALIQDFGDGNVPFITHFVIDFLPNLCAFIASLAPIILGLFLLFISSKKCQVYIMACILKVPTIGDLLLKTNFWQVSKIMHIALDAKLDFIEAMNIAINSIKIQNIKDEFLKARQKITDGYPIAEAFSSIKFASSALISAVDIGEENSDLSASFEHISSNQYEEIILDIKDLGRNLSVGLTLFTGLIFLLIICGLFFPIYSYVEVAGT